jgi:hypothetical protein
VAAFLVSAVACVLAACVAPLRADLVPAPGYQAQLIASGTVVWPAQEYNPATDTWLGIDTTGFDYITEATRGGTMRVIADTFGLGGLGFDQLAVASGNLAWVTEGHARSVYTLVPATLGATKTLLLNAPGDRNEPWWAEYAAAEADANGDLIVGFGPQPYSGSPTDGYTDWYRVTQAGGVSALFTTTGHNLRWLRRDSATGTFYGIDVYDPTNSGPAWEWYVNERLPRLVTLDTVTGAVTTIRQYAGLTLLDIEMDRTRRLVPSDVLWAVRDDTAIVPLDPATGEIGAPLATATEGWGIGGLTLAPSSANPSASSLYAEVVGGSTFRVVELAPVPEPSTLGLLAAGAVGLLALACRGRCGRIALDKTGKDEGRLLFVQQPDAFVPWR